MPDKKISDLVALSGTLADGTVDLITVVDMSETGAARNKKMTLDQFVIFLNDELTITESQISDLQSYLLDLTGETIGTLSDVVITTPADNEVLAFDTTSGNWINQTAVEAGLATSAQGALADSATQPGDNISTLTNDAGYTTNTGTVTSVNGSTSVTGLSFSGGPITGSGTLTLSGTVGAVAEAAVTAHQTAITITESQISDLGTYITDITGEVINDLSDVTITTVADNEILQWNATGGVWENQTLSEAGIAAASHTHSTTAITSGTFADARISESNVTQHQAALTITESQISDLGTYLVDITGEVLSDLSDVTITTIADNEILQWNSTGGVWENQTLAEAGIAAVSHTHAASDVTSGTFDNARIAESNVTQHQAALTITESQISDLSHADAFTTIVVAGQSNVVADAAADTLTLVAGTNITITTDAATDTITITASGGSGTVTSVDASTTVSGLSFSGGPITASGTLSLTGTVSAVTEGAVTAHQAALTITESQISDLGAYLVDITGESVGSLSDVTITAVADNEILQWNSTGGVWENQTLAEAGISAVGHTHATTDITSGTFADARIAASNVTQHQAALTITESQISDLGTYLVDITGEVINDLSDVVITTPADNEILAFDTTSGNWINQTATEAGLATSAQGALADSATQPGDNISTLTNDSGYTTNTGTVTSVNASTTVSGLTFTGGPVTASGTLALSGTVSAVTEGAVTAHQAALSITESQISDLGTYLVDITGEAIGSLSDVTITTVTDNEILQWNSTGGVWENQTLAEAGISAVGHTHATTDITSGTFADARIAASNVTQHQAALTITESQISDYDPASANMARIGGSTYSTIQHLQDIFHSAGASSGGTITDAGGSTFDVAGGTGFIRATDSDVAQLLYFDWPVSNGNAISDGTTLYVGVEYNGGSPQITTSASNNFNGNTSFLLGSVTREGADLHISNTAVAVGDHAKYMIKRIVAVAGLQRDKNVGGLILSETGTRNITLTTGHIWAGLRPVSIPAIDTSTTGTFTKAYKDGAGGWTLSTGETQWHNTEIDDGNGVLGAIGNNKWVNIFWWVELDGDLVAKVPENEYNSQAEAEAEGVPTDIPISIANHGFFVARTTFQKSASSFATIANPFTTTLSTAGASNHASLSNLGWTNTGHTGTASTIAGFDGSGNANETALSNFLLAGASTYDFGGATSLEVPNSATPTVDADGEIAVDTTVTDFSHGILKYYSGEEMAVVAMPIAQLTTPTDGYVVAYNATNDEFELVAQSGGGGGGSSDLEARNESGATLTKGSPVYIDSYDVVDTQPLLELAQANAVATADCVGLMKADLANNAESTTAVQTEGYLSGLDTSAFAQGDPVYVSDSTAGGLQNYPGTYAKKLGQVVYSHASNGIILLQPDANVFETGTGQGSKIFLFENTLVAADSEIVIDGLDFDYWDHFEILLNTVTPSSLSQDLRVNFRSANSDITGTYEAGGRTLRLDSSGTTAGVDFGGTNYAIISQSNDSGTDEGTTILEVKLFPHDGTRNQIRWTGQNIQSASVLRVDGECYLTTATEADGLRLVFASGNIAAGATWKVWGVRSA